MCFENETPGTREAFGHSRVMGHKDKPRERPTEDDLAKESLGPRGVPGKPDTHKLTEKEREQLPPGEFDGHTA